VDGALSLQYVGKDNVPVKGDVLLTSGMGGAYPKGLVVGEVSTVAAPQADLYPKVGVQSRVPIDRIEEVLVLAVSAASQSGAGE
jgi:rod shape-determining protein MreC